MARPVEKSYLSRSQRRALLLLKRNKLNAFSVGEIGADTLKSLADRGLVRVRIGLTVAGKARAAVL